MKVSIFLSVLIALATASPQRSNNAYSLYSNQDNNNLNANRRAESAANYYSRKVNYVPFSLLNQNLRANILDNAPYDVNSNLERLIYNPYATLGRQYYSGSKADNDDAYYNLLKSANPYNYNQQQHYESDVDVAHVAKQSHSRKAHNRNNNSRHSDGSV